MNLHLAAQALAGTAGATAHTADTTYALAFLSSTAVELVAIAALFTMLASAAMRFLFKSSAISDYWVRLNRAFDILKLSKMVIPLACLSATVWVWSLVQGV